MTRLIRRVEIDASEKTGSKADLFHCASKVDSFHRRQKLGLKGRRYPLSRKMLPAKCERTARSRNGRTQVFAANCLNRNFRGAAHLPRQCAGNFKFGNRNNGRRPAYTKRCLRSMGYRTARN